MFTIMLLGCAKDPYKMNGSHHVNNNDNDNSNQFQNETCINKVYNDSNIDGDVIDRRIQENGGLVKSGPNLLLDTAIDLQKLCGVTTIPSLFVNCRGNSVPLA